MHWSGWIIYTVVALWLAPAMLVHHAARVLFCAWFLAEMISVSTGNKLPIGYYVFLDAVALFALWRWGGGRADRAIMLLYAPMALSYGLWWAGLLDNRPTWWALYWLAMTQFVIAGPWLFFSRNRTTEGRMVIKLSPHAPPAIKVKQ